jgi:hypothetical protein
MCLGGMHVAYLTARILGVPMTVCAASVNFTGAKRVKAVTDKVQVSQRWTAPFGDSGVGCPTAMGQRTIYERAAGRAVSMIVTPSLVKKLR